MQPTLHPPCRGAAQFNERSGVDAGLVSRLALLRVRPGATHRERSVKEPRSTLTMGARQPYAVEGWFAAFSCVVIFLVLCAASGCGTKDTSRASGQPLPYAGKLVEQDMARAFTLGLRELAKEGVPLEHGTFSVSIEPYDKGYRMHYRQIPQKVSGDRLLLIQGNYVNVIHLF